MFLLIFTGDSVTGAIGGRLSNKAVSHGVTGMGLWRKPSLLSIMRTLTLTAVPLPEAQEALQLPSWKPHHQLAYRRMLR